MGRRQIAGTGWKMNISATETGRYAQTLRRLLAAIDVSGLDIFVLPPFTSLHAAERAFAGSPVAHGGQNMHWDASGAWTGEISAPMLTEAGCRYVELAHSERLAHFGETYDLVEQKIVSAIEHGLTPILCLGETAEDKRLDKADQVLSEQLGTALAGLSALRIPDVVLAYEPRWAIGAANAAPPDYVAARHAALRALLEQRYGAAIAETTRVIYGGSVTSQNGAELIGLPHVDGLFAGRAAWTPEGFFSIIDIVNKAAQEKEAP